MSSPALLRIYNKGTRLFKFHGIELVAKQTKEIPAEHTEFARKLLLDYKDELMDASQTPAEAEAAKKREDEVGTLRARVRELEGQQARAQTIFAEAEKSYLEKIEQLEERLSPAPMAIEAAAPKPVPAVPKPKGK